MSMSHSQPMNYNSLPLVDMARAYLEGMSLRALSELYGCPDHKTVKRYIEPYVLRMGGAMRNHKESQRQRRLNEFQADGLAGWPYCLLRGNHGCL